MKCPECNQTMIDGYVPSNTMRLQFIPKNGNMPKTIFGLGKFAVPLSKMPAWVAAKAPASFCKNCRFVIIKEFKEEKANEPSQSNNDISQ